MGRNKKANKKAAAAESSSDAESDSSFEGFPPPAARAEGEEASSSSSESEVEEKKAKKAKPVSKKALQRIAAEEKKKAEAAAKKGGADAAGAAAAPSADVEDDDDDEAPSAAPTYPLRILYCPITSWPAEMCEYSGNYSKCKEWHVANAATPEALAALAEGEKGRKQRVPLEGGATHSRKEVERVITLDIRKRVGRKYITIVRGLELFGLNSKALATVWKKRFSCGCTHLESEHGNQAGVELQGDFAMELRQMLTSPDNKVPDSAIIDMKEGKRPGQKPAGAQDGGAPAPAQAAGAAPAAAAAAAPAEAGAPAPGGKKSKK
jgi:translation initiation factor 1 (eIF-1/SUI1)